MCGEMTDCTWQWIILVMTSLRAYMKTKLVSLLKLMLAWMECKALFFLLKTVCLQEGEYDMFINGSSPVQVEVRGSTSTGIKHTHTHTHKLACARTHFRVHVHTHTCIDKVLSTHITTFSIYMNARQGFPVGYLSMWGHLKFTYEILDLSAAIGLRWTKPYQGPHCLIVTTELKEHTLAVLVLIHEHSELFFITLKCHATKKKEGYKHDVLSECKRETLWCQI